MRGTIAITDYGWYERLRALPNVDEVNFWKPTATRTFQADEFSPFLFKLRAPHRAICGFGFFARYSRLPDWLAWDTFDLGNGCASLEDMRGRILDIRERIHFRGAAPAEIGCILLVQPLFFPPPLWVAPPRDWPIRTQAEKKYDLDRGEGARVWADCLAAAHRLTRESGSEYLLGQMAGGEQPRYGTPFLTRPRLGQRTFRIAVTDSYERGCAVTGEHSLPALEAAHIKPYHREGPHEVANGLLLRADLHRLLDKGYVTISTDLKLIVSRRLQTDFSNGRTYYPLDGRPVRPPRTARDQVNREYLKWHNNHVYLG